MSRELLLPTSEYCRQQRHGGVRESRGTEGTAGLRAEASAGPCEMSAEFEVGYWDLKVSTSKVIQILQKIE